MTRIDRQKSIDVSEEPTAPLPSCGKMAMNRVRSRRTSGEFQGFVGIQFWNAFLTVVKLHNITGKEIISHSYEKCEVGMAEKHVSVYKIRMTSKSDHTKVWVYGLGRFNSCRTRNGTSQTRSHRTSVCPNTHTHTHTHTHKHRFSKSVATRWHGINGFSLIW